MWMAMALSCLLPLAVTADTAKGYDSAADPVSVDMVLVPGGTFEMGDVFGEGGKNEQPVHTVRLSDFLIGRYEVTVGQFREFVEKSGYVTSAEASDDSGLRAEITAEFASGELSRQEMLNLKSRLLELPGAGYWDAENRTWTGYNPQTDWNDPGIKQADNHPVLAVSYDDAMHYCNWLSETAGLPVAYDLVTGDILDKDGLLTDDITVVKGYRLPTEAEWEYAARDGGQKKRFGNGKNVANPAEMNFCGDKSGFEYCKTGVCLGKTSPVGNYLPNSLGLYDMSGNAWEWVSDSYVEYRQEPQVDPYAKEGANHALRGGRWGGDASEARVFSRSAWPRNDRCNNSGFRIARSAK
jgi:formylglycine-generating enzyme required for sulfatase activity